MKKKELQIRSKGGKWARKESSNPPFHPARQKEKKKEALPRFELRLKESESSVLTATL